MKSEIIKDLIGKLILIAIILVSVWYLAGDAPEPQEEAICNSFPCKFQGPVYHLAVTSAKYEWIEKHGK